MEKLELRLCRNLLLNEYPQRIFFAALKDKGITKDEETMTQILGITGAILLETRTILAQVIDTLLLEKEELKHDELQRLRTLLEDQRIEYVKDLPNLPQIDARVNKFLDMIKK